MEGRVGDRFIAVNHKARCVVLGSSPEWYLLTIIRVGFYVVIAFASTETTHAPPRTEKYDVAILLHVTQPLRRDCDTT